MHYINKQHHTSELRRLTLVLLSLTKTPVVALFAIQTMEIAKKVIPNWFEKKNKIIEIVTCIVHVTFSEI